MIASFDKKARASLSTATAGSSFVWKKDGLTFATTGTGSNVDQRPDKNYKYVPAQSCTESGGSFYNDYNAFHKSTGGNARKTYTINGQVSFTFTGVEFGLVLDWPLSSGDSPVPGTFVECQIDGGVWETINPESMSYDLASIISWGKPGLTNTSHTVNVRLKADADSVGMIFDGFFYSDRSVPLGTPVEYSVVIDGTTTETVTVTPAVDREANILTWVNQIVSNYATYYYGQFVGFIEITDWLGALAMAYHVTGDSRLPACADKAYTACIAHTNSSTGQLNDNTSLIWNSRIIYNFWLAFKIFGDSKFLAVADKFAAYLKDSWPRGTTSVNGVSYSGLWYSAYSSGGLIPDGNGWSTPSYGLALLYNETTSIHYHNSTVYQRILDNSAFSMTSVLSDGTIIVGPDHSEQPTRVYGTFQHEHIRYLSETLGIYVSESLKMAQWLSSLGTAEPYWYVDAFSHNADGSEAVPKPETNIWDCSAFNYAGVTIPQEYIDRAYSAAFTGPYATYDPRGAADTIMSLDSVLRFTVFWSGRAAYIAGIPASVWAYDSGATDTTAPIVDTFTIPSTSASLTVPITSLIATDAIGVAGYLITESATAPLASDLGWSPTVPESITLGSAGSKTLYAWAKDAAGNVSAGVSAEVVIITPVTADIAIATATGCVNPLVATAVNTATPFLALKGANGATYPMYLANNSNVGFKLN